jgi:hypothetical protein
MVKTGRDPFARQNVRKRQVWNGIKGCDNCGCFNKRSHVWQYYVETDTGRTYRISGVFCGVDCLNSYHS